jgi:hypothetical protein
VEEKKTPFSSVAAALVLAVLTLAVFVVSRGRGPQSSIQRLHEALSTGDRVALVGLYARPRGPYEELLEGEVFELLRTSRSIQLTQVQTMGRKAQTDVVYDSSVFGLKAVSFVLDKTTDGWAINAPETLARTRESSLF